MFNGALNLSVYGIIIMSLFMIDYALGNGFVDMFQKVFCKLTCFVMKSLREEAKQLKVPEKASPLSLPLLLTEMVALVLTICLLNRCKSSYGRDRIDELLQESKDALHQTNEFLEKWRLRRLNWESPTELNYLDEEPQEIKPMKLEVPILHMAIINSRGTARSQLERGDAGDLNNVAEFDGQTLFSLTSLDDLESIPDTASETKVSDDARNFDYKSRYQLWDVAEEGSNIDDI